MNINFVDPDVLKSIIRVKGFDSRIADRILSYRKENEIKDIEELKGLCMEKSMQRYGSFYHQFPLYRA